MWRRFAAFAAAASLAACGASRSDGSLPSGAKAGPAGIAGGIDLATCNRCHGGAVNAAPPRGLHGETETSDVAVGAHQSHLVNLATRAPLACDECHLVPAK